MMPKAEERRGGVHAWQAGAASQAPAAAEASDAAGTASGGSGAYQMGYGASSIEVRLDANSLRGIRDGCDG